VIGVANETSQVNVNQTVQKGDAPTLNRGASAGLGGKAPLVFVVLITLKEGENEVYFTYVMGDTYPFKDLLKKHGFTWAPAQYLWSVNKNVAKQIAEELRNAGAEVMEASRLLPNTLDFDIIKKRIEELIKRGVIEDVVEIANEIRPVCRYDDDHLLPFEMEIKYIINTVRRKYQLNADFEEVLKLMLEGRIGEEKGWMAKERLQKFAKAYMRLRDIGLTDLRPDMISLMGTIYELESKRGKL
jgi:hypothetical protein